MKIGDVIRRNEWRENQDENLKKNQKYRLYRLQVDWYENTGFTKEEMFEDYGKDDVIIDGRLWVYDEKYCNNEHERIEQTWHITKDMSYGELSESISDSYNLGAFMMNWENGFGLEIISDEDFEEIVKHKINLQEYLGLDNEREKIKRLLSKDENDVYYEGLYNRQELDYEEVAIKENLFELYKADNLKVINKSDTSFHYARDVVKNRLSQSIMEEAI